MALVTPIQMKLGTDVHKGREFIYGNLLRDTIYMYQDVNVRS